MGQIILGSQSVLLTLAAAAITTQASQRPKPRYYSSITAHDEHLYVQIAHGTYVAVDLDARAVAWRFKDRRLGFFTKPAFSGEAVMIAATAPSGAQVLSLTEGHINWRTKFVRLGGNSLPVLCGPSLLVHDYWRGQIRALDLATGRTRWQRGGEADYFFQPPAVRDQRALYAVAHHGRTESWGIAQIDCVTGAVQDSLQIEEGIGGSNYPVLLYDGRALLITYGFHTGVNLKLVDLARKVVVWDLHMAGAAVIHGKPIIAGDKLILAEDGLWIVGLESGKVIFHKGMSLRAGSALAGDRLVLPTGRSTVCAIDLASYKTVWETALDSEIVSDVVYDRGSIYVRVATGRLLQIKARDGTVLHSIALE